MQSSRAVTIFCEGKMNLGEERKGGEDGAGGEEREGGEEGEDGE